MHPVVRRGTNGYGGSATPGLDGRCLDAAVRVARVGLRSHHGLVYLRSGKADACPDKATLEKRSVSASDAIPSLPSAESSSRRYRAKAASATPVRRSSMKGASFERNRRLNAPAADCGELIASLASSDLHHPRSMSSGALKRQHRPSSAPKRLRPPPRQAWQPPPLPRSSTARTRTARPLRLHRFRLHLAGEAQGEPRNFSHIGGIASTVAGSSRRGRSGSGRLGALAVTGDRHPCRIRSPATLHRMLRYRCSSARWSRAPSWGGWVHAPWCRWAVFAAKASTSKSHERNRNFIPRQTGLRVVALLPLTGPLSLRLFGHRGNADPPFVRAGPARNLAPAPSRSKPQQPYRCTFLMGTTQTART